MDVALRYTQLCMVHNMNQICNLCGKSGWIWCNKNGDDDFEIAALSYLSCVQAAGSVNVRERERENNNRDKKDRYLTFWFMLVSLSPCMCECHRTYI